MKTVRVFSTIAVGLSCVGLILPTPILNAAPPASTTRTPRSVQPQAKSISDVKLDSSGYLQGMVVDLQGAPVANAIVIVRQGKRDVAKSKTDKLGRFSSGPMGRGTYLIRSGGGSRAVRAWTPQMAPPAARELTMLITGSEIVRGQMPLEDFFSSDAFVITGLVAAMIAIPIAVHNSGSKAPASP